MSSEDGCPGHEVEPRERGGAVLPRDLAVVQARSALLKGQAHSTDDLQIKIKLVAPPLYVMTVSALDKARGIQLLADAIAEIEEAIKASKGALQVKVAPRAVDERDDKLLNSLMSTLDAQNQEVDGDADEDEQDEGMGSADISGV